MGMVGDFICVVLYVGINRDREPVIGIARRKSSSIGNTDWDLANAKRTIPDLLRDQKEVFTKQTASATQKTYLNGWRHNTEMKDHEFHTLKIKTHNHKR